MRNCWRRLLAVGTSACLLVGCGLFSFPAGEYAEALCDVYYKEEFEDYATLTGAKEKDIQEDYDTAVTLQARAYMEYFGLEELNEDGQERLEKFVRNVYAYAKYDISSVKEKGSGYAVTVEVEPIAFYKLAEKEVNEYQEEFRLKTEDGKYLEVDEAAYQSEYLEGLLKVYESHLEDIEYLDKKEFALILQKSGKEYVVEEDGFAKLDAAVIAFSK